MGLVYCGKFDTDLKLTSDPCGINDIEPMAGYDPTITNTDPKFGLGSMNMHSFVNSQIHWHPAGGFPALPGNEGTVAFWIRRAGGGGVFELALRDLMYSDVSSIYLYLASSSSTFFLQCYMYDNGGNFIFIDGGDTGIALDADWHYVELNWTWNNILGNTEVSFDGTVYITNISGNTEVRTGSDTDWIIFSLPTSAPGDIILDDLAIYDTRQHNGNFSVPTAAQCACAAAKRMMTLGAPFGMPNNLGR